MMHNNFKPNLYLLLLNLSLLCSYQAQAAKEKTIRLNSFTSDGCSLFPDHSWINSDDWSDCCYQHDLAYWQGGTWGDRKQADKQLQQCVIQKTDSSFLGFIMYNGVRVGGQPTIPTWFRWGYGWNYSRGYRPLSDKELKMVKQRLKEMNNP